MSMVIDLDREIRGSKDLRILTLMLKPLVGRRCLEIEISYGEELMLHIGEGVPYAHPKLANEKRGSWVLGTRASWWTLELGDPPSLMLYNLDPSTEEGQGGGELISEEDFKKSIGRLIGATISAAVVTSHSLRGAPHQGYKLMLAFDEGSRLTVTPNDEPDDEDPPLADWELFTPNHRYLVCGPGLAWSYQRSDDPEIESRAK